MTKKFFVPGLVALALLGACATATPYQPATPNARGYSNQQIESNRWMVSFAGNSLTDRQTVETYLLYRAAELTSQNGYDYFRVVRRATDADKNLVPVGTGYSPYYGYFAPQYRFYSRHGRIYAVPNPWAGFGDPFGPSQYREIQRYEASAEILMGRGPKPDDPAYFDAQEVRQNLSTQIVLPER